MTSRRVLLVLVDPPLPFGRAMGRWYHVLMTGLKARGYQVTALATCISPEEIEQAKDLFPSPDYDLRCYLPDPQSRLTRVRTLWQPFSYPLSATLRRDLAAEAAKGFDVMHLEVLWSGYVGLPWASRAVVGVPYLCQLDLADQPSTGPKDWLRRRLTYRAERILLRSYPRLIAVSPRLARSIHELAPDASVDVIPFGLDLSLYPFDEAMREPNGPLRIGMVASFNWTPGATAGRRILNRLWPEIRRRVPNVELELAGVGARDAFRDHLDSPGVIIRDRVDDVRGFFRSLDLQLYPPNPSSGMKFKVLEAFALGVPVVTNAAGVEGMPVEDGVHAGLSEDDAGLIERTVALLQDPARRQQVRYQARELLKTHCSPESALDRVERIYNQIITETSTVAVG